jgi:hypothetical protein
MKSRKLVLAAAATLAVFAISASAAPHHARGGDAQAVAGWQQDWRGHGDREWQDNKGGWHQDRDRYWRSQYGDRKFVDQDSVFRTLKKHHYNQFEGAPFWFHGRFMVKTFDRRGNVVMIEVNPYSGAYIGLVD